MALLLGVLIIHGITPDPTLMVREPDIFWGLVMSFWIGNLMLLVLNIPLIGLWIRLLQLPFHHLYPAILVFVCIGVYSAGNGTFDIWMVLWIGILGYGMRLLSFPTAPLLLRFVLAPLMEGHFRRTMIISSGNLMTFLAGIKRQHEPPRIVGDLLSSEIAEKQARSIKYQMTLAKLPLAKDIDDFDFTDTPVNQALLRELTSGTFVADQRMELFSEPAAWLCPTPGRTPIEVKIQC